jgi:hypothetical protein
MRKKLLGSLGALLTAGGLAAAQTSAWDPPSAPARPLVTLGPPTVLLERPRPLVDPHLQQTAFTAGPAAPSPDAGQSITLVAGPQDPIPAPPPPPSAPGPLWSEPGTCGTCGQPSGGCNGGGSCCCQGKPNPCAWLTGEYLLWRVKDAPLGVPVATVATPGVATGGRPLGALGTPGTVVLSPSRLDLGTFSGFRLTGGLWLDADDIVGVEANAFWLPNETARFSASSGPGGTLIFVPFLNEALAPPAERAFPFGADGATNGSITVRDRLEMWGAEANLLVNLASANTYSLIGLGGFRYLDLRETLNIDLLGNGPGFSTFSDDQFRTRNQFYGGQLGLRGEVRMGWFFANLTGQVALGDMVESVTTSGFATQTTAAGRVTVPGGFFVQTSNAGRFNTNRFVAVPEVRAQVGVDVTNHIRVHVGYDFLYVSDVLRPGNQIDRRINFSQQAAPVGGGGLVGPALPAPLLGHNNFWAQGLTVGVTIQF